MSEIPWTFNASAMPEILGPRIIERMQPGHKANLNSDEGMLLMIREDPRYRDGTPSEMFSFKLINYSGPYPLRCFDRIQEAFECVARQGWVDCIDYPENGFGIRWIFFYGRGKDNGKN